MKQEFSLTWKASKQPRKQRKYRYNAPFSVKRKLLSANLSKELRKKYGRRSFPLRKGDSVVARRGEFKGKSGTISMVNYKRLRVSIEGIFRTKKDGSKVPVYFYPSVLQIKEFILEDRKRKEALERKNKLMEKKEVKQENKEMKKETKEAKQEKFEKKGELGNKTNDKPQFKKLPKEEKK